ncbi:MAG: cation diffusion facilitator family transporter [Pseudomonadales bacterium]|nr:cation diffusion facilitator family transporter [Pseudomonadales bacterium]
MAGSSKKAIYAALVGNALIAVTKFGAASYTGSAAMLSEGIHSLVDTGNQVLLLFGIRQSIKPASPEFPFGHGKEIYFWCFIVAMLIFALGGTASIYQGVQHLSDSEPITNILINYVVLGFALVFELGALYVAFKEFNKSRGRQSIAKAVRDGKDPTLFVVVFEDTAATLGLLIALLGLVLFQITGNAVFDALASIAIGVVLIITAFFLALESKNLLIGESASIEVRNAISEKLANDPRIITTNEVATLHMGPDFIVVTVSADFVSDINSDELEAAVTEINGAIKSVDDRIKRVFVEAERPENHGLERTSS